MNQPEPTRPDEAILLIAHGSRRQQANDDLIRLRDMVRVARAGQIIEHSFLELANPTIPEGAASCVEQGARKVLMFPYFLSAGVHVVEDLKKFKTEFENRWPETTFQVCPPLGLHRLMVDIVFDRISEVESS
ncbi:MAG: CbiX/SirB N-terminal domain-containing protein [Planctomycetaceae bacterium]|nr:CbiX/SirB N-terminal domain-containing protein [Planctomycetaceae bacterium]